MDNTNIIAPADYSLPIAISRLYAITGNDWGTDSMCVLSFPKYTSTTITVSGMRLNKNGVVIATNVYGRYIAICQ